MSSALIDKIVIAFELELVTGMHIGASKDFAPIGAVDSVVVRDPLTRKPIIPGSSIKGKMRSLLWKANQYLTGITNEHDYSKPDRDHIQIKRLFGSTDGCISRLQFADSFMKDESVVQLKKAGTDLYLTEIKFENVINRLSGKAEHPRQIERVPAGSKFDVRIIYSLYSEDEASEDFYNILRALQLLQLDYIGGNGSRGYGRVSVSKISLDVKQINGKYSVDIQKLTDKLQAADGYGR